MRTLYHVTEAANLPAILHEGLRPQVGRRSEKLTEKTAVFLFLGESEMEDGCCNWLFDEFDDDVSLSAIELKVSDDFPLIVSPHMPDVEVLSEFVIPPSAFVRIKHFACGTDVEQWTPVSPEPLRPMRAGTSVLGAPSSINQGLSK